MTIITLCCQNAKQNRQICWVVVAPFTKFLLASLAEFQDRLCQVCHSSEDVEDEQHFMFDCPAYDHMTNFKRCDSIFQQALSVSDIFINSEPNVVEFPESVLHVENSLYPPETIYTLEYIILKRVASQY